VAKVRDMILVDGVYVCPKCFERRFQLIKNKNSYSRYIKDYCVTSDGKFKFVYICDNCSIRIVEIDDMKKRS